MDNSKFQRDPIVRLDKDNLIHHFTFHDNNKIKSILTKQNGKNHGVEKEYDRTGKCIYECNWVNGKNMGWVSKL